MHTRAHSFIVRKSGRVPFSHFNQNACLTYRCQTSLVLITNITKVFVVEFRQLSDDVALLLTVFTFAACMRTRFPSGFFYTFSLDIVMLKASTCIYAV